MALYYTPSGRSIQRPLPGTALTFASLSRAATSKEKPEKADLPETFHTDDGRPVTVGGGTRSRNGAIRQEAVK